MTAPRGVLGGVLALAILAGLVALAGLGVVAPILARLAALEDERADTLLALARFEAERVRLAAEPPAPAIEGALLDAASPAQATADLQARIDAAISTAGGERRSLTAAEPEVLESATRVSVTVDAVLTTPALQEVLYALETGQPYLTVARLDARPLRPESVPEPGEPVALLVRIEVQGVMQRHD